MRAGKKRKNEEIFAQSLVEMRRAGYSWFKITRITGISDKEIKRLRKVYPELNIKLTGHTDRNLSRRSKTKIFKVVKCQICGGTGIIHAGDHLVECIHCEGSGKLKVEV